MAAPSHAFGTMDFAAALPVHSDRIVQVSHLIPFYPDSVALPTLNLPGTEYHCYSNSSYSVADLDGKVNLLPQDWVISVCRTTIHKNQVAKTLLTIHVRSAKLTASQAKAMTIFQPIS